MKMYYCYILYKGRTLRINNKKVRGKGSQSQRRGESEVDSKVDSGNNMNVFARHNRIQNGESYFLT